MEPAYVTNVQTGRAQITKRNDFLVLSKKVVDLEAEEKSLTDAYDEVTEDVSDATKDLQEKFDELDMTTTVFLEQDRAGRAAALQDDLVWLESSESRLQKLLALVKDT